MTTRFDSCSRKCRCYMKSAPQFPLVSLNLSFIFSAFYGHVLRKKTCHLNFSFLILSFRYILLLSSFLTHVVEKQHAETLLSSQTCFAWRKGQAFYDGFHVIVQSLEVTAYFFLPSQDSIQSLCCTGTCISNIVEIQNCGWEEKNSPTMSYHSSKVLKRHYIDIYLIHLNT